MKKLAISASSALMLIAFALQAAHAQSDELLAEFTRCLATKYKLEKDNKKHNIEQILAYGRCVRKEQRARVGKWFCYVSNQAGVQTSDNGQVLAGAITPRIDKFVVSISELSDDDKKIQCEWGEYGVNLDETSTNFCLANYKIDFSPDVMIPHWSEDSYSFGTRGPFPSFFVLYGIKTFVLFRSYGSNSYVSHGRCEKIN